ncbi:MAG: DNA primase [Actinobacteria bacterium]|nr:DNA primase [Actinomycetota bacterium]
MAGRIRNEDVVLVRERARIDEVVREHVSLKSAGGASLKGLCPFHDEKSPSFHVTPSKGFWYCFGCGEGGDVIGFLQKIEHLSFSEVVEKLAGKYNIQLRYDESSNRTGINTGQRTRLVEANKLASEFFAQNLNSPEADICRKFLTERGFDKAAAHKFGVGYALKGWDSLTNHLKQKGFTEAELTLAGLSVAGQRGVYDRFRGRLTWPIRDASGDVVGFGARRLYADDQGPKYLNTPETPVYKKSQVLYGIDLARKDIASSKQAVIVEGYTDVMACHLAGVTTAVATCGTAFGEDHARVLRRFLMDQEQLRGEIIYTFDGDEAGRKAALKAFNLDQSFVAQTFVAVESTGLDPCELRQKSGNDAIVALVKSRVPLFEFVIKSTIASFDLNTAEGRVSALRSAAPVVAGIKDVALRPEYTRMLAGWLGADSNTVVQAVGAASNSRSRVNLAVEANEPDKKDMLQDTVETSMERECLKLTFQFSDLVKTWFAQLTPDCFSHQKYREIFESISNTELNDISANTAHDATEDEDQRALIAALSVEEFKANVEPRYVDSVFARVLEINAGRTIADLKSQLQRLDPATQNQEHDCMFQQLLSIEEFRRALREQSLGTS